MKKRLLHLPLIFAVAFLLLHDVSGNVCENGVHVLENQYLRATFGDHSDEFRLISMSRLDGSDLMRPECDVFEIMMLNGERFTVDDYSASEVFTDSDGDEEKWIEIVYVSRNDTPESAPDELTVIYWISDGPLLFKEIDIPLDKGDLLTGYRCCVFQQMKKAAEEDWASPYLWETGSWDWITRDFTAGMPVISLPLIISTGILIILTVRDEILKRIQERAL